LNVERAKIQIESSQNFLKLISRYLNPSQHKKLLDVGAGGGILVDEANKFGFDAVGIEINKLLVAEATKRNIPVLWGNIENIEIFPFNYKFDIIVLNHLLEHLNDPVKTLSKLKEYLRDGGFLIIEVPNIESYLAKKHKLSWKYIALEHIFYFSEKTLSKILSQIGFKIIDVKRRNFEISHFSGRTMLQYILGTKIKRDRFKMKVPRISERTPQIKRENFFKKIIKRFLVFLIKILGREDHLIFITKKL